MKIPKIKKLPSGSYHAQVQIDGKRISITADTKKEVEQQILSFRLDNKNTTDRTLSECIDKWLEDKSNILSPSTKRGYEIIKRNRFQSVMNQRIDKIQNWQKIINDEAKLVSAKTLKNAWGFVRSVLVRNGVDPGYVLLPMVINKERNFLQPDEIKRFAATVYGHPYEIAYLACLHGLRASEMMALDKCDVSNVIKVYKAVVPNDENKYVIKYLTKNKTSTREVPVIIPRLTELASAAPEGRLVNVSALTLNKYLKRICEINGLPIITLHELRHSYVSLMYFLHIPEQQAMEFGGYSDIQTMRKIYTHLSDEGRKNATDKMTSFFL